MHYRTFIGLDVHARSVKAGLLDGETGEIAVRSAPARTKALVDWILALPGPAAVAYEAGPTGYGLARALDEVGVACLVAAPSAEPATALALKCASAISSAATACATHAGKGMRGCASGPAGRSSPTTPTPSLSGPADTLTPVDASRTPHEADSAPPPPSR
jgi:hypothetical protein